VAVQKAVIGTTSYFAGVKATTDSIAGAAILLSIPTFGVFLRTWRGGVRFWRIPIPTLAGLVGMALATLSVGFVGLLSRPALGDVSSALAAGNVARARQVVAAIEERDRSPAVANADDQVTLAEANKESGSPRLALLDKVAARGGVAASTAGAAARADRLAAVRKIADAHDTKTALANLDRDFPGDKSKDPLVAEERAHAYDAAKAACATPACQFNNALAASTARTSPERAAAVDATRTALVAGLDHAQVTAKDTLPRLQQLRTVRDLANETLATPKLDADLTTIATTTRDWANGERAKVPMLWSDAPVVSELVAEGAAPSDAIELKGATVIPAFAGNHKCAGVYAIGNADASRSYNSMSWPPERLLSQAVGKPATIHKPANNDVTTTNWYESGFPVVARWRNGQLVELRIGDAAP
jgi:chitodextrinase